MMQCITSKKDAGAIPVGQKLMVLFVETRYNTYVL